jgi:peptidoglycan/xylan/chitin deacetylase (PgdA/CDA1 family)
MRIPNLRKAGLAAPWLRTKLRGQVLVLGYHRVDDGPDPYGMAVRPDRFAAHLDVLARSASVLPLAEAIRRTVEGTLPPRAVTLTFDDGYADLIDRIEPLLAARDMTATAFIATGFLGGEFWWDRLARILGPEAPAHLLHSLSAQLEFMEPENRDVKLGELEQAGRGGSGPWHKTLTSDELGDLAARGVVEIGAHTVWHGRLTGLRPESRRREVRDSKQRLEEITGRSVTAFSYPHGAFDRVARDEVRDAGYALGCNSLPEAAWRGSDPLGLPRLWPGDWPADRFEAWLRRWMPWRVFQPGRRAGHGSGAGFIHGHERKTKGDP